jgi:hypothetical protein
MSERSEDRIDVPLESGALRAEYERELGVWLRRRLGYLCIAYAVFQIISVTALLIASSGVLGAESSDVRTPTPIERRAERAERRADAGLAPLPGDQRALVLADEMREREERRRQRERSAKAVVSTLDAFSAIAREFANDFAKEPPRRVAPAPRMVPMDRWYLDEPRAGAVATQADAPRADEDRGEDGGGEIGSGHADGADATHVVTAAQDTIPTDELPRPTTTTAIESEARANDRAALSPDERALPEAGSPTPNAIVSVAEEMPRWILIALSAPSLLVLAWFGIVVRRKLVTRAELVGAATRMILILGFMNFIFETALLLTVDGAPATPLLSIFFWHFTASLFLPWSWRESLKPIAPLLACWLLLSLGLAVKTNEWLWLGARVIAIPAIFAPALLLCYFRLQWHQNRFKTGFVGRRFLEMKRDVQQARAVHESLFPKPFSDEYLRFDFGYRPATEIGGDFIHAWTGSDGKFHLALIDVTGHGLASAMSVARIHGEIERLRDEHPDEGPAKLLARLNRYFHRLLAKHRLYATGILLTVDPRTGELRYSNAGHPPMFLRSKGELTELPSTTFLLGAVDDAAFGEDEVVLQLEERDTLILFTDGAYDAKSPRGERFGLERLRETVARPVAPPKWTAFLMRLVETFEAGLAEDDLLIAEVTLLKRVSVASVTGDGEPLALVGAGRA